ncbi:hypothetical protein [Xanthomonas translucens]|uniref:Uncharacterized protein n=3 Tax=Xanthomonas campestris pv. translucens TaxID=343 RepID=A0A109HQ40_XANCT|nr:hypothetical protein [Xanthomonas translucens]KTF39350.1 hypothetical protein OZ12_12635 [Xanthomonas translucens pv. translucens]KWV14818.1 hypothetical protein ATB53_03480 [Xanthomonas translucens]KWV16151.1 hypothetical protein ATB54_08755 [Xanthomonas translucens]MCC8445436.1 hypothetical protein [Xanthomonas translucens pv. translucens]MCS3358821.1 hypothetical protein [Xanthomonas translucens pv. translucens]
MLLADARPLALAPADGMPPMAFRPTASGEVVERDYTLALPTPEYRDGWRAAATMALDFCERVAQAGAISSGFRGVATRARQQLGRALQRIG